jgi:16S rRNA (guanine(527)-N(7))-methyltransferase RsmG
VILASAGAVVRLGIFLDLLRSWNQRINLIARGDAAVLPERHVADSLSVVPLAPPGTARAVDLGSGGGLPGVPFAIASGIETHLIDRDQRKCAFLREAARVTGAPVVVHAADFVSAPRLGADLLLSRATAALPVLLDAGWRHGRKGVVMLLHKSSRQSEEIAAARARWRFDLQILSSPAADESRVWRISGLEPGQAHGP